MYQGKIIFQKEKESEIWPRISLSVDLRSTAGRLGFSRSVGCRSTAGRPYKMRELQVWPVECIGRLPVDRYRAVSSRFPMPVDWLVNRSTAYSKLCTFVHIGRLPPLGRSTEVLKNAAVCSENQIFEWLIFIG